MGKAKFTALKAATKKKINRDLHAYVNRKYHEEIPIMEIDDIIYIHTGGMRLLQEDGCKWSGILCGAAATCTIDIGMVGGEIMAKNMLDLQWYKMPSGKYEINCYVS